MSSVVRPPSSAILRIANLLDEAVARFLRARSAHLVSTEYESHVESHLLMNLMMRNVESVALMARTDLVLFPSALILTRSVFELSTKILWMLGPSDPFDCEVRWLAHLRSEEDFWARLAKRATQIGQDSSWADKMSSTVSNFRAQVESVFPSGYQLLNSVPDLASMLRDIGEETRYSTYIILSQYTHGSHYATGLYRKNLGMAKAYGEYVTAGDWHIVLSVCWYCLATTGRFLLDKLGGSSNSFISNEFIDQVENELTQIKS